MEIFSNIESKYCYFDVLFPLLEELKAQDPEDFHAGAEISQFLEHEPYVSHKQCGRKIGGSLQPAS